MKSDKLLLVGCIWMATLPILLVAVAFGSQLIVPVTDKYHRSHDISYNIIQFDSLHYYQIIENGYTYEIGQRSNTAFFPLYPLLVKSMSVVLPVSIPHLMIILSQLFLLASVLVLCGYLSKRSRQQEEAIPRKSIIGVPMLFLLCPIGLFLHLAYTESLFCLLELLFLTALRFSGNVWKVAWWAGVASATRPVGLALSLVAMVYCFQQSRCAFRTHPFSTFCKALTVSFLSVFGLLCYMAFLYFRFDEPLAFIKAQYYWSHIDPASYTFLDKLGSLLSLEPIIDVYYYNSIRFWGHHETHNLALFSLFFWNPIAFLIFLLLAIGGWRTRLMSGLEFLLCIALLMIAYLTRAYEMSMASHARFASVLIPCYLPLWRLICYLPLPLQVFVFVYLGLGLFIGLTLFAAGYPVF